MKLSDSKQYVICWAEWYCSLLKEAGLGAQLQEEVATGNSSKQNLRDLDMTQRPL